MANTTNLTPSTTGLPIPISVSTSGSSPWALQALTGLVFGVFMLGIALYTLWQIRHRPGGNGRAADEESFVNGSELQTLDNPSNVRMTTDYRYYNAVPCRIPDDPNLEQQSLVSDTPRL
ncbi:hypothetical protein BDZ45DRAFT_800705 [Acephala macrosclerotiorum]|nr:hypothetical protein BDZ45DRAFT_800705 [Acephala macrosclerotiorum]